MISLLLRKLPRLTSWWLFAIALSLAVFIIAPQQLAVSLYKLNLLSLAAVAGYWIDRSIFVYARPNSVVLDSLQRYCQAVGGKPYGDAYSIEATPKPTCPDHVPIYYALGCMIRRALIVSAAMLSISLGA